MSRPFTMRLIAPFAAVIMFIVLVCGALVYWVGQRTVHLQQIQDLDRLTQLIRQSLGSGQSFTPEQRTILQDAAKVLDTRITLVGSDGEVIFDSHGDASVMENHNYRPEIAEARKRGISSIVRSSDTIRQRTVYVARPLDPDQPNGIIVRLSFPQSVWPSLAPSVWGIVIASLVAALLVTALFGFLLQRQWVEPVRMMSLASERMAAGQWGVRVDRPSHAAHEIQDFADKLNTLASQAQQQLNELQQQRGDLQALVDTLPDPILVSDSHGRIALVNTPAANLMELSPMQLLGRKVVSVVNEEVLLELFDQIREAPHISLQREIRLVRDGQRLTFQAVARPTTGGGALVVLRDITTLAGAVQMKADFVANASHELRTPIAAIKVAFETLRDIYTEDPQQTQRCIQIIEGHLLRLEEMLRDLLDLSRVESPELQPQITHVRIADLFQQIRATMGPMARDKNVELQFTNGDTSAAEEFRSDQKLLNLILKNLVENSVKFTPGGGKVAVSLKINGDNIVELMVADTGIGIPPEHLDRVFERFYQADVARSGSAGRGTGLGLAIVKHAVAALGGTVDLKSQLGQGTTVTCTFPTTLPT